MPSLLFKNSRIVYKESGKGEPIILLHGFTESMKIWTRFARDLSKEFRVILIDLPGHGKSECVADIHTMELQAEVVHAVLKRAGIGKCLMAGHSMGGYVTLAFARRYPKMLRGICIFHSHCFPDTPEEKENRTRTIELVKKDKFGFVSRFIPSLFPEEVHSKFSKQIDTLVKQAGNMPKEGVIAALEGMKVRRDQSDLLASLKIPVLFMLGLKDSRSPIPKLWEMISLPPHSESLILKVCGHMGYIEFPEKTLTALRNFTRNCMISS